MASSGCSSSRAYCSCSRSCLAVSRAGAAAHVKPASHAPRCRPCRPERRQSVMSCSRPRGDGTVLRDHAGPPNGSRGGGCRGCEPVVDPTSNPNSNRALEEALIARRKPGSASWRSRCRTLDVTVTRTRGGVGVGSKGCVQQADDIADQEGCDLGSQLMARLQPDRRVDLGATI